MGQGEVVGVEGVLGGPWGGGGGGGVTVGSKIKNNQENTLTDTKDTGRNEDRYQWFQTHGVFIRYATNKTEREDSKEDEEETNKRVGS